MRCPLLQRALAHRLAHGRTLLTHIVAGVLPVVGVPELVAAYLQADGVPLTDSERAQETQKLSQ